MPAAAARTGETSRWNRRASRLRRAQRTIEPLERRLLLAGNPLTPLPYQGHPQGVPGTIEAENYDTGGEGVSFHDPTPQYENTTYRPDSVGIAPSNDAGGGYLVGWTNPGEWLNYTVNVAFTTTYSINFRVACGDQGGTFHVNVDGVNATGPIQVTNTGGWATWTTITVPNVTIPAGQHVLTLSIDSAAQAGYGVANFNWMQLKDNPYTSPRTQWWRDAKYGLFIHWGLYSQLAGHWNGQTTTGYGEWIMNDLNIPLAQYAQVANQFDPTQFSAQQWVQIAKDAGMQYIVLTTKHHDGFSMFDTSVNTYNVVDATPWGQDPVAELSAAAHAAGLHFGAYYSILNWADPNASAAGINTYMVTMETQLKELITNDHPDVLWFDGEWPTWWTDELGRELQEYVQNLDPAIIINNRVGKRLVTDGDFDTPEQTIPTNEPAGRLWETAMTINDTWGYKDTDTDFKSWTTILQDLTTVVSGGGNYLLNVGPTGAGVIPAPEVQVLDQVGSWLAVNGQAIYGTVPSTLAKPSWGQLTQKGNSLYAIVYSWPSNGVLSLPLTQSVAGVTMLSGNQALSFATNSQGLQINVPGTMPMQPATVIRIDLGTPSGTISGNVFNDLNHDGVAESGEGGLAGVTVYLDANNNGRLDSGETSTTTDVNGNYTFVGLAPGTYIVREVVPSGDAETAPLGYGGSVNVAAGQTASGPQFGDVQISSVLINFSYLTALAQHYDQPATFAGGDVNGDGTANFQDLVIVAQNYGKTLGTTAAAAVFAAAQSPAPSLTSTAKRKPVQRHVTSAASRLLSRTIDTTATKVAIKPPA